MAKGKKRNSSSSAKIEPERKLETHKARRFSREDKLGFGILLILYAFQGIPLGFFPGALQVILSEKGAHFSELSALSLATFPFAIKIFFAPILDSYGIGSIFLGYHIETWVTKHSEDIAFLALIGFSLTFCMALQDIAVDGWVITLLSPENISYGSTAQSIGQTFGELIGYQFLVPLNSVNFCNRFIFSTPRAEPLVTLQQFLIGSALVIIAVNFIIHFFVPEKNPEKQEFEGIMEVIKMLKGFWKNPNLRLICFVLLTNKVMYATVDGSKHSVLIKKGFSKDILTTIQSIVLPLQFISAVFGGALSSRKKEIKMILTLLLIKCLENTSWFLILQSFDPNTNYNQTIALVACVQVCTNIINNLIFVSFFGFFARIADEEVGGTFLTCLASFMNFGDVWTKALALNTLEYVPMSYLAVAGWLYGAVYIFVIRKPFYRLQFLEKSHFSPLKNVYSRHIE